MAQIARASAAPLDAAATTDAPGDTYAAPPIPSSLRASLQAWWRADPVHDAAHAELHLYRPTGYFAGATVANAPADDGPIGEGRALARALDHVTATAPTANSNDKPSPTSTAAAATASRFGSWLARTKVADDERLTVATRPAPDGKLGQIRFVDLGPATATSDDGEGNGGGGGGGYTPPSVRKLNMLEIGLPHSPANRDAIERETKIVLLHGYGAGTAFFFQNLASLASIPDSRLYALDWLGMGRSSRPTFHLPAASLRTVESRVAAAESFFVDSLEQWRSHLGIKRMVLVGHSLGGLLSTAYALRYPHRVERLVLVSPVGVPHAPPDQADSQTQAQRGIDKVQDEVKKPQDAVAPRSQRDEAASVAEAARMASDPHAGNGDAEGATTTTTTTKTTLERTASTSTTATTATAASSTPRRGQTSSPERATHEPPRIGKTARTVLSYLWESNVSPFGLLRASSVLGPWMAGRYTSRRFASLPTEQLQTLHSYCQSIFLSRGSGEYCLAHLLKPGAYARIPIVERIEKLRREGKGGEGMPVTFMYGEYDWMDVAGGRECVRLLRRQRKEREERKGEDKMAKTTTTKTTTGPMERCYVVPKSGHHIYLDNPAAFDELLKRVITGADR